MPTEMSVARQTSCRNKVLYSQKGYSWMKQRRRKHHRRHTLLYLTCKWESQHLPHPLPSRRRAVSGSLPRAAQRSTPPTRVLRLLSRRIFRAVVVFVFRGSLGLHGHDEGLAFRQVGPALGHVGLCPIQHHSYGMIGRHTHTHSKS